MEHDYDFKRWDVSESDWKIFISGVLMGALLGGIGVAAYLLNNVI